MVAPFHASELARCAMNTRVRARDVQGVHGGREEDGEGSLWRG